MTKEPTNSTIEEKVAQTILQQPLTIDVGDQQYQVAPPSTATLILVSAAVSRLPHLTLDQEQLVQEAINVAKDCQPIGEIVATLILGAKHVNDVVESYVETTRSYCFGLFKRRVRNKVSVIKREALSRQLLEELTPRELQSILVRILNAMEIGDFFGLTTFLLGVNTIKRTKVESQTASGA